ncbi:hypothetical protein DAEQUDRAFT_676262 [Daedalea quercina L-15889]|uniref:Uncharacterized protein n=1 Tax=Daedalea quercina L-15889 TaxID=1314783 RepID=A0A165MJX3_9APHY|nr:hypothetical protein DAEQUDRAFT_676262 [Daedalea quercina L-15889]
MSVHDSDYEVVEKPKEVSKPPSIAPALSLDLRVRWLETLLYGARAEGAERKHIEAKNGETLARRAEELQQKLDEILQANDGLRKFMEHYDQHAQYLTPSFALSGTIPVNPPIYENMSASELEAFLTEMEPDIRAAERDMREIAALEEKGVTGAGRLTEYKDLQPRLNALLKAHEEDAQMAARLEKRIAGLMDRYATRVDTLSELFLAWDESLRTSEDQITKLERDHEERRKLGYE